MRSYQEIRANWIYTNSYEKKHFAIKAKCFFHTVSVYFKSK
jgi:hypothetical protein